jgi:hypothetical protein
VTGDRPSYVEDLGNGLRVLIVAGIPIGVLVAGIGGRLAMFALRLTSDDSVNGVVSDDGFVIGRLTLAGTYNLLLIGATVGIIGAAAYQWVRPWLLGPSWFRRLTTALGSGIVVGSMLLHADGVDFTLLQPTWLAIGLFVALPMLFGLAIGPAVDRVGRAAARDDRGWRRWVVPAALVAAFPLTLFVLATATVVLAIWLAFRRTSILEQVRASSGYAMAVRSAWLVVAGLGLLALTRDVSAIT